VSLGAVAGVRWTTRSNTLSDESVNPSVWLSDSAGLIGQFRMISTFLLLALSLLYLGDRRPQ
jgi:hypothetical protein